MPVKYKVENWKQYEEGLRQRGAQVILTIDHIESWHPPKDKYCPNGRYQRKYSKEAIDFALLLAEVFEWPLRMVEGYLRALFKQQGLSITAPDHTTLVRRRMAVGQDIKDRAVEVKRRLNNGETVVLSVDSTGLQMNGENSWRETKYGKTTKNFAKISLLMDVNTMQTIAYAITDSSVSDDAVFGDLIDAAKVKKATIVADGAYDKSKCYQKAVETDNKLIAPPREGARLHDETKKPHLKQRNEHVKACRKACETNCSPGCKNCKKPQWKKDSGYHMRSKVESLNHVLKRTFGHKLSARTDDSRRAQIHIRINALNEINANNRIKSVKSVY